MFYEASIYRQDPMQPHRLDIDPPLVDGFKNLIDVILHYSTQGPTLQSQAEM